MDAKNSDVKLTIENINTFLKELKKERKTLIKNTGEPFSWKKLGYRFFGIFNWVTWSKWLVNKLKDLIVIILVVGVCFGVGYFKGKQGKPIFLDINDFETKIKCELTGEWHTLEIRDYKLYFDGVVVTVKDIPKIEAYGIDIYPKLFAGIGVQFKPHMGIGFELAHFYKFNFDAFIMTDKALYIGISYDIRWKNEKWDWFRNSSVGLATGKSIENLDETRIILYWTIPF